MTDTRNFANALENEGSAPVYLLDKKLDERTSQSAVETTDYVLLEDTDGAFHRIAKNSFNEAVRGALGSLLNNLDKGTNIKSVVGLGSASPVNDLGTVTLANLASLLGVRKWKYADGPSGGTNTITTSRVNSTVFLRNDVDGNGEGVAIENTLYGLHYHTMTRSGKTITLEPKVPMSGKIQYIEL